MDDSRAVRLSQIDAALEGVTTPVPSASDYLHHVATADLLDWSSDELARAIAHHAGLAAGADLPAIGHLTLSNARRARVAIQVVSADGPFLVDTISLTVTRLGWEIHGLFHPQMQIDPTTRRPARHQAGLDDTQREVEPVGESSSPRDIQSWVQIVASPPAGRQVEQAWPELESALREVLADLAVCVADWQAMAGRVTDLAQRVRRDGRPDRPSADDIADLLDWLVDGHFLMLGVRELHPQDRGWAVRPGSGLGLLREDRPAARFDVAATGIDDHLLVITKDSARSTIRHAGQYDHFSVRTFDEQGTCTAEHQIVGLLASTAYTEQVQRIPLLRGKVAQILQFAGYPPDSYGAKAVAATIATHPRDELFQAPVEQLAPVITRLADQRERRELFAHARWGTQRRFLHVLVSLPRDRYTTESRRAMEEVIRARVPVETIDFRTQFSESVLCRVFFTVKIDQVAVEASGVRPHLDQSDLRQALAAAVTTWDDEFEQMSAGLPPHHVVFSDGYKEDSTAEQAVSDLQQLLQLGDDDDMQLAMFPDQGGGAATWRVKVMRLGNPMTLSDVMPQFTSLGLEVIDERPYELRVEGRDAMVYDFGVRSHDPAGQQRGWDEADTPRILAAFEAVNRGWVEADPLNELVTRAGLTWRQVRLVRAMSRYLLQAQRTYSQAYIAQTLLALPELTVALVEMAETKFDPERFGPTEDGLEQRREAVDQVRQRLHTALEQVRTLDHDRILRQMIGIVDACVRTNHHQRHQTGKQVVGEHALALKLLPGRLDFSPEPRPAFEIFVHSARVEGVHLRFGEVARGGLRWSDRAEDFRTEVLGLVKAQMVKNTVIVPVGAKGGFLPRQLPDPGADRAAWLDEGKACYRIFITSLLDVTDNLVDDQVVHPDDTVCHDADDTYLVVAADKGTATFSDLANQIAVERGFWLGDAFASGGSHGYDHKAMGITARGAWESVKRHFGERGVDCQSQDFTCVAIGDMSGDVFGNGMLCSRHTRLVGAFNHQHVFIDPDPDAATSYAERERLFRMPRSSWADYNTSLISEGGGVFDRAAKSVPVTAQMRAALGLPDEVASVTGSELVKAVLRAPVDLLFNGGIGTYVKADTETHDEVGDRANDSVRIDGAQLRCHIVGEGGNLGFTQAGRVEYALAGGQINTDFIDNSAGVDTSDHEVNIKILLGRAIAEGQLDTEQRDALLPQMTDEVAELVLRHNIDQNVSLSNALARAADMAGVHEALMSHLEQTSQFDREVEQMPAGVEMVQRITHGAALTAPELATLMAWSKIDLEAKLLDSDLPDDPYLADRLTGYFPSLLRERFAEQMSQHPLRRQIITTVAVNRFVNSQGITSAFRLTDEFGVPEADVVRAQLAARAVHGAGRLEVATARTQVHPDLQRELRLSIRRLIDRATRWVLQNLDRPLDVQATIDRYSDGVAQVQRHLEELLGEPEQAQLRERIRSFGEAGVGDDLARLAAAAPFAHVAMGMVRVAERSGRDLLLAAGTQLALQHRVGLDVLLAQIEQLPRRDRWQAKARSALRGDLLSLTSELAVLALAAARQASEPGEVVDRWWQLTPGVEECVSMITEVTTASQGLAPLQVALRTVRELVATSTKAAHDEN